MTVDELIEELSRFEQDSPVYLKDGSRKFNFGDFSSYRGYYDQLSVDEGQEEKSVREVIYQLKAVIGETFEGYKGGHFTMDGYTDVYFAEYGQTGPVTDHVYQKYGVVIIDTTED